MKCRTLFLAILGLTVLLSAAFFASPASTAAGSLTGVKVCLDPGHGGLDPGAVNADFNLHESAINLDVSYGLKALLEGEGAEVVMTRTGDDYLTNNDRYTFCNGQQATILVSVHTNSVANDIWDGSMTLYAPSRDPYLAQAIHDLMYPFLRDTAPVDEADFRDFGLDNFASGVLFKCDMPAAMVEPLFMSHPAEAALLVQSIYDNPVTGDLSADCSDLFCRRGQIAQAVLQGVLNYYSSGPPPSQEPGKKLHVANVDMWYELKGANIFIYTSVAIQDRAGNPVPGATVAVTTTKPDPSTVAVTGVTGDDGVVTFKLRSELTGQYTSAVTGVSKERCAYEPAGNVEESETLTVP